MKTHSSSRSNKQGQSHQFMKKRHYKNMSFLLGWPQTGRNPSALHFLAAITHVHYHTKLKKIFLLFLLFLLPSLSHPEFHSCQASTPSFKPYPQLIPPILSVKQEMDCLGLLHRSLGCLSAFKALQFKILSPCVTCRNTRGIVAGDVPQLAHCLHKKPESCLHH